MLGRYEPEPPEPGRTEPGYSPEHMDRILRRLGFPEIPRPDTVPANGPAPSTNDYFDPDSTIPTLQAVADLGFPAPELGAPCLAPETWVPRTPSGRHLWQYGSSLAAEY
jgi:hypothetical protein